MPSQRLLNYTKQGLSIIHKRENTHTHTYGLTFHVSMCVSDYEETDDIISPEMMRLVLALVKQG